MASKDILLQLDSYPEPTSPAVIERGVWWARHLGTTLTALAERSARMDQPERWLITLEPIGENGGALSGMDLPTPLSAECSGAAATVP